MGRGWFSSTNISNHREVVDFPLDTNFKSINLSEGIVNQETTGVKFNMAAPTVEQLLKGNECVSQCPGDSVSCSI